MFRPVWLVVFATGLIVCGSAVQAQEAVDVEAVGRRFASGQDLIDLRWQRDAKGQLSWAEPGSSDFVRLFPAEGLGRVFGMTGSFGPVALVLNGRSGLLGVTDGERHLRRLGIRTAAKDLVEFAATPMSGGGKELAEAEVLDRMVAVDLLCRRASTESIPQLQALADAAKTPEPLRKRVIEAIAALRGGAGAQRARLDPATLPLPVAADVYLILDGSRLPDLAPLVALARSSGLLATLKVLRVLKTPLTEDLIHGQWGSELCAELPFELVRRYGDQRIDHLFVALLGQPTAPGQVAFCAQMAGAFSVGSLAALRDDLPLPEEVKLTTTNGKVSIEAPDLRADVDEKVVTAYSRSLRGRPRPQVAAELLAGDAAFKMVIPAQSKAWIAMAPMGLPPTVSAEATLTLGPAWVLRVTITARNEDAAQEWVAKAKEFAEEQNEQLLGKLADESALKELRAALPGGKLNAEIAVNGRVGVIIQTVMVQGMPAAMEAWVRKQ